ncbi:MAG: hypothetical protein JOZ69_04835 [Myxococcales bacterium]|nr:hypothetical protein [Myxococcales bacterium]
MSDAIPPVLTLLRSPERAAVGVLHAAAGIARNALLAANPQLACDPTGDPLDRAVRRLLRRLDRLDVALHQYVRADDEWEPKDDLPF